MHYMIDQDMNHQQKRDGRNAILQALRSGPLTLTELSSRTGYRKSTISYHVRHLLSKSIVEKDREGRYSIGGDRRIQVVIVGILIEERKTEDQLLQDPGLAAFDKDSRRIAFETLKAKGDIESELVPSNKPMQLGDIVYRPSFRVCARKDICYMCLQPVKATQDKAVPAIAGLIREEIGGGIYQEAVVDMHPACFSRWLIKAGEDLFGLSKKGMCSLCGLPLSPPDLWDLVGYRSVDIHSFESLMTAKERELYQNWRESPLGKDAFVLPFARSIPIERVEAMFEQVEIWTEKRGLDMPESWGPERKRELLDKLRELEREATDEKSRAINALFLPFGIVFGNIKATYAISGGYETTSVGIEGREERSIWSAVPISGDHALFLNDSQGRRFHPYCYGIYKSLSLDLGGNGTEVNRVD
jgi:DNA-binding transcriptional ArsR family regulator